jgi:hypothetical protein
MLLFRFVMQGFDATPTPGICSVVVIHYRDHNGSIVLDFTPGSTVDQILMQFTDAIHEQPCLHTEYLLHHSWLPSNYFAGALLLENPLGGKACLSFFMCTTPLRPPASIGVLRENVCFFHISNIIMC